MLCCDKCAADQLALSTLLLLRQNPWQQRCSHGNVELMSTGIHLNLKTHVIYTHQHESSAHLSFSSDAVRDDNAQ
jgi:hypothetical protein